MFDQDEQDFSQIIETGVELILSGKATLEQFLGRYPDRADAIRPELEVAIWLSSRSREVAPRPGFVSASRRRVLERIQQEAKGTQKKHAFMGIAWPKRLSFQWVAVALVLLVLFSGTGGMVTFAQGAIPGDNLYEVKRTSEQVAYNLSFTDTRRVALSARFAERRLDEAGQLIQKGDTKAAEEALSAYQQEVSRTIALIQVISVNDSPQAARLAKDLQVQLTQHAQKMEEMQVGASADVIGPIDNVQEIIQATLTVVDDLTDGVFDLETATPTLTETPTLLPTDTDVVITNTPLPPNPTLTPLPSDPLDEEYPTYSDTLTETAEVLESNEGDNTVPEVQPSSTPKPPNPNKYIVPGLTDNPSDSKPTKEKKPTKDK